MQKTQLLKKKGGQTHKQQLRLPRSPRQYPFPFLGSHPSHRRDFPQEAVVRDVLPIREHVWNGN
jgi:hypothetical protein